MGLSSAGLGDGMMQAKRICLPSFLYMTIFRFFCWTMLLKFVSRLQRSPRAVFIHVYLCGRTEPGASYVAILMMSFSWLGPFLRDFRVDT